ncbi:23S rRNA (uracil(1939)-C(5))-methyltransferase RlmD [Ruminococcus sp.]|uniref:23S rRNA (uracil(1939)-C(5))-methyltransferase RlmD n=1 Tax=Ruminococcus sp. TaxID=41978 RepID=UPI0025F8A482|nr:23S rRNA (uracil(1939)-C(5))-methyltransferase RlmD [Ruminococcus sp.]MBQ8967616.1 23S rRNA (uracil(1939)-C(5))-methyltransferase RlmD [Ruminococcus sp.]
MEVLKKNDIIPLEIVDVTNEGNGVGRYNGVAIFVPAVAVGDVISCRIVKVKSSYCYGKVESFTHMAGCRIETDCPVSKYCGGCSFRHITYEEECRLKESFIRSSFERIGKLEPEYLPFVGCKDIDLYRNKAQYPVADENGAAVCGFYARRSHRVVKYTGCKLQPAVFSEIVDTIISYVNSKHIPAYNEIALTGLLRHIYLRRGAHSGEIMVCLVITDLKKADVFGDLVPLLLEKFKDIRTVLLNENPRNTNVILGSKMKFLYGDGTITDIMCGNKISISPLSFYQVNTIQAELLYSKAAEFAQLTADTELLDLYCGTGTIGLSMARQVKKLFGVEIIQPAIDNAVLNAQNNGIDNAEFICGDAGKVAKILYDRGERPNVIIADPARKGCDRDSLEYMAKMSPDRIVMISCNHTTAARDCAILGELGYSCDKVVGVDLFPRTTHVECVILLSNFRSNDQ